MTCRASETVAAGDPGLSGRTGSETSRLDHQLRASRPVDRAVDAATTGQRRIRRVDDRVDVEVDDVPLDQLDPRDAAHPIRDLRLRYDTPAMTDSNPGLATPYRTHTCGQLRVADAGSPARLAGWVHRRRDLGHLIFLDVRDRHGITQVVIDKTEQPDAHATASRVRTEFVLTVAGEVAKRLAGTENAKLTTGDIELRASEVTILSESKTPPFPINEPDAAD